MDQNIQQYWDERARQARGSPQSTTDDVHLRKLEARTITRLLNELEISADAKILDVGCGDGKTTLDIARQYPQTTFCGIDYSPNMIAAANSSRSSNDANVSFHVGDAEHLDDCVGSQQFTVVLTNRSLINLSSREHQFNAMRKIAEHLVVGGYYLGTENFINGQTGLNSLRKKQNLEPIAVRWHNLFFEENELIEHMIKLFKTVRIENFSSTYYLITRVVYSALCKKSGTEPDYYDPIHEIAAILPPLGDFSPIKLIVAQR